MLSAKRIWGPPKVVDSAEDLAEKLTQHTWTLCASFEHAGYLYLNDSGSEDGAQEFAILKPLQDGTFIQVNSITFSWCTSARALEYILEAAAGKFDSEGRRVSPRIDRSPKHRCALCA